MDFSLIMMDDEDEKLLRDTLKQKLEPKINKYNFTSRKKSKDNIKCETYHYLDISSDFVYYDELFGYIDKITK